MFVFCGKKEPSAQTNIVIYSNDNHSIAKSE